MTVINCSRAQELILRIIQKEQVTVHEQAQVTVHVATCEICAKFLVEKNDKHDNEVEKPNSDRISTLF